MTEEERIELAELLFPGIEKTPEDYEKVYPERDLPEGAMVTRLGPSPTGFIHLGNLYGAFVDERLAHQSGGTFYLRIEDTDDKRYVEGASGRRLVRASCGHEAGREVRRRQEVPGNRENQRGSAAYPGRGSWQMHH